MSNDTDSFVQEVDERLREERMTAMVKRYGMWWGGAFIALLLAILGYQWFTQMQTETSRDRAQDFATAQEQARGGDLDAALASFTPLTEDGPRNYRVMAMMERAALLQAQGDLQGALAGFDAAAEEARDPLLKSTSQMRAAYIVADTQDFQAVQARLQPIIDEGGAVSFLARELLGVEAWEAGNPDLARETLQNLTLAFEAPESVRQRAQLALSVLPPPAEAPAAPAPAPEAAEPSAGETK